MQAYIWYTVILNKFQISLENNYFYPYFFIFSGSLPNVDHRQLSLIKERVPDPAFHIMWFYTPVNRPVWVKWEKTAICRLLLRVCRLAQQQIQMIQYNHDVFFLFNTCSLHIHIVFQIDRETRSKLGILCCF